MEAILSWMKGILVLFLVGHVLLYLVQNKTYEKYIRFFVRILILFAVIAPVTRQIVDEDAFIEKIEQAQFFQELKNGQNRKEMELEDDTYCRMQYETICNKQIEEAVNREGYEIAYAKVTLNDAYEIEKLAIGIKRENREENMVTDTISVEEIVLPDMDARQMMEETEKAAEERTDEGLEEFLCENYQLDRSQIIIEETRI